ncbi:MAG: CooT family nickel-binding protein [Lachnospiraceae bacterium]|nr:CooT family nickel-binding protein [Lachnospiraceae bacterium]MCR5477011.1 CooT family nickel-binding protein [Lachnospiraceae bacterium]
MCLSTAFKDSTPEEVLMEFVQSVKVEGENITLTDMMGEQKTIKGQLTYADLTGAVLKIKC